MGQTRVRKSLVVAALFLLGCPEEKPKPKPAPEAGPTPSASASATPSTKASASTASTTQSPTLALDAGASVCKKQIVTQTMRWVGPAALAPGENMTAVANKQGSPDLAIFPVWPLGDTPRPIPTPEGTPIKYGAGANPCATAGKYVFCMDREGAVRRSSLDGRGGSKVVARAKPGTRISAAMLGDDHTVLAYLDERKTTEGFVWEAYVVGDEGPDVQRLSEDGSGATFVDLASRGNDVLAMLVDARSALTPVHARVLTWDKDKPKIGADAVVFVGGPPERRTAGALATDSAGGSFSLVPLAYDEGFGLGIINIGKTPSVDAPVLWSKYPNGLDPASVAATRGVTPIRVARVRPAEATPESLRVLELGRIEPDGRFTPQGVIAGDRSILDVAVSADKYGALWVYYTIGDTSYLERRACP
jgi:hypothetical protein